MAAIRFKGHTGHRRIGQDVGPQLLEGDAQTAHTAQQCKAMGYNGNSFPRVVLYDLPDSCHDTVMHLPGAFPLKRGKCAGIVAECLHGLRIVPDVVLIGSAFQHAAVNLPQIFTQNGLQGQPGTDPFRRLTGTLQRTGIHRVQWYRGKPFPQTGCLFQTGFSQRDV